MKSLTVCLLFVAVVAASFDDFDFSQVIPLEIPGLDTIAEPQGPFIEGRITNGQAAVAKQFKYQAGLLLQKSNGYYWCGGSLISNRWVLTAAHCAVGVISITVNLGTLHTAVSGAAGELALYLYANSSNVIVHSGYNATTLENDVSLIQLPQNVTFTDYIQPAKLPSFTGTAPTYAGSQVILSGWGITSDNATSISSTLQWTTDLVITNQVCSNTFGTLASSVLCISTPTYKSTCSGDSGGPLTLVNTTTIIGVTSFVAAKGCTLGYPAGFSRVTSFLPWIQTISGVKP